MACAAPLDGLEMTTAMVGDTEIRIAVASTAGQRHQGLADLGEFPASLDGMLFSWEEPTTTSFGMSDTQFPLDIWWFDEDGHLLGSAQMEPCRDSKCVSYASPGPVMWALETPLGEWEFALGSNLRVAG